MNRKNYLRNFFLPQDISVKGDEIINESGRTRLQKKNNPNQWTSIPLLAKIFKLLVGEFSDHLESALASSQDPNDSGPDESDEEWEDEESSTSPLKQFETNKSGL